MNIKLQGLHLRLEEDTYEMPAHINGEINVQVQHNVGKVIHTQLYMERMVDIPISNLPEALQTRMFDLYHDIEKHVLNNSILSDGSGK
ncbi:hypothetical protein D3C85_703780 [compost metagenome]